MNIRTICLAILAHGEASGYDLKKHWEEGPFHHLGGASFGSIYPALARMEKDGLIRSREEVQPGKPARRVYSLTETGYQAFIDEMSALPEPDDFRSHFGVITLCARHLTRDTLARALDERVRQQKAEISKLTPIAEIEKDRPVGWLIEWGLAIMATEVAFIEKNRARLEAFAGTAGPGDELSICCLPDMPAVKQQSTAAE